MRIFNVAPGADADSGMPAFAERFRSLVDPAKIELRDNFRNKTAGNLKTQSFDFAADGQTWSMGTTLQPQCVPDSDGGYIYATASVQTGAKLSTADGKVYAAIRWGSATSFCGIAARYIDGNNWGVRATISNTGPAIRIDRRNAGGATELIQSVPFSPVNGEIYHLGLECDGDDYIVTLNNEVVAEGSSSLFATEKGVAVSLGNSDHRILEFVAGRA